jgi:hypothetical protein
LSRTVTFGLEDPVVIHVDMPRAIHAKYVTPDRARELALRLLAAALRAEERNSTA